MLERIQMISPSFYIKTRILFLGFTIQSYLGLGQLKKKSINFLIVFSQIFLFIHNRLVDKGQPIYMRQFLQKFTEVE